MDFKKVVDALSSVEHNVMNHYGKESVPYPSEDELKDIVELTRTILFPGFYGRRLNNEASLPYHMGVNVERLYYKLVKQIMAGLGFAVDYESITSLADAAHKRAKAFVESLPELRDLLATDVTAHYRNDPAAHNEGEVILCYPGMKAISSYRIAHRLVELDIPLIPRMISELAHAETGIDIHPGARIGHSFAIDHGTGVVIGATSIIGHNVTIYQGVTLGAKNFPQEEDGTLVKGIDRHPILGDHVIVYANATILGRITIGNNSVIGGNIWVTNDVPADTKLFYKKSE